VLADVRPPAPGACIACETRRPNYPNANASGRGQAYWQALDDAINQRDVTPLNRQDPNFRHYRIGARSIDGSCPLQSKNPSRADPA
jgi:hypothetical protein